MSELRHAPEPTDEVDLADVWMIAPSDVMDEPVLDPELANNPWLVAIGDLPALAPTMMHHATWPPPVPEELLHTVIARTPAPASAPTASNTTMGWLAMAVFVSIIGFLPFGFVGIVFAVNAESARGRGDNVDTERNLERAKPWIAAAAVAGLAMWALLFAFVF